MKKYVQNIWVRLLACILCTVAVIGIAASALGMFLFAEYPEKEDLLRDGNVKLMDNYAFYAMDNLDAEKLDAFFEKTNMYLTIEKYAYESEEAKNPVITETYSNMPQGMKGEQALHEILQNSSRHYSTTSLIEALNSYVSGRVSGYLVPTPIEGYAFDVNKGLFYYQTPVGYFEADYIYVCHEGESYDYRLTIRNGVECYYNSYYGRTLDASKYQEWDWVRLGEKRMGITEVYGGNIIQLVTDSSVIEESIRIENYELGSSYLLQYVSYKEPYYYAYMAMAEELTQEDLFYEWNKLVNAIYGYQEDIVGFQWACIFLLILGIVLLAVSAPEEKEKLRFFHKIPVVIFTAMVVGIEALLCVAVVLLLQTFSYSAGWIVINIIIVMIFIAFVYLANIMTRIKTGTLYRYSELYYISRPIMGLYHVAREHTSLFWKGLIILLLVSFAELFIIIACYWEVDVLLGWFFLYKVVEIPFVIYALVQMKQLQEGGKRIASGELKPIDTSKMFWEFKKHGENINKVREGISVAVEEQMKSERFKTELITNVSHDIKTPLTSIINYVDLIKKENITDSTICEYIDVLDRQSARLKKLIEDLMEASKASTGNVAVHFEECDMEVLLTQVVGEFEEKLMASGLEVVVTKPEAPVMVIADGRHLWRVLDNLMNNICKYSQPNTRVYVSLVQEGQTATVTFKNISKTALNISSDQLLQRFVRGDSSRHTEGSGLGLSIAQSLTELMNGKLKLEIDGDLFKVILTFNAIA